MQEVKVFQSRRVALSEESGVAKFGQTESAVSGSYWISEAAVQC